MEYRSWLSALAISGCFLIPAGVLLLMTSGVGIVLETIWNAHFLATGPSSNDWDDLLRVVTAFWFLGLIGAFWGKGKGRVLLVLTHVVFAVMACGFLLAISP